VTLTFDDNASTHLTATDPIAPADNVSVTNQPSIAIGGVYSFEPPAPPPPYVTRLYNLCNGGSPNGVWSLFVVDDQTLDSGFIAADGV